jgi:hypothetical protein
MKQANPVCPVALLVLIGATGSVRAQQCDQSLWNHVYHPARLQVVNQCMEVKGTIRDMRGERDGDYHIQTPPPRRDRSFSSSSAMWR